MSNLEQRAVYYSLIEITTAEVCRTENKCNIEDNCRVALLLLTVLLNSEQKPGVEMKAVSNNLQLKNVKAYYKS